MGFVIFVNILYLTSPFYSGISSELRAITVAREVKLFFRANITPIAIPSKREWMKLAMRSM